MTKRYPRPRMISRTTFEPHPVLKSGETISVSDDTYFVKKRGKIIAKGKAKTTIFKK